MEEAVVRSGKGISVEEARVRVSQIGVPSLRDLGCVLLYRGLPSPASPQEAIADGTI